MKNTYRCTRTHVYGIQYVGFNPNVNVESLTGGGIKIQSVVHADFWCKLTYSSLLIIRQYKTITIKHQLVIKPRSDDKTKTQSVWALSHTSIRESPVGIFTYITLSACHIRLTLTITWQVVTGAMWTAFYITLAIWKVEGQRNIGFSSLVILTCSFQLTLINLVIIINQSFLPTLHHLNNWKTCQILIVVVNLIKDFIDNHDCIERLYLVPTFTFLYCSIPIKPIITDITVPACSVIITIYTLSRCVVTVGTVIVTATRCAYSTIPPINVLTSKTRNDVLWAQKPWQCCKININQEWFSFHRKREPYGRIFKIKCNMNEYTKWPILNVKKGYSWVLTDHRDDLYSPLCIGHISHSH